MLHIKITKQDDDKDGVNDVTVNGSLPISLSDLTVKVKINFEKIVINTAMSVGSSFQRPRSNLSKVRDSRATCLEATLLELSMW